MGLIRICFLLLTCLVAAQAKPVVVATDTVLADITRTIAGDELDVRCLLPVGIDPHSYEPTPADVRLLAHADLVIENGLGLESWSRKLVAQSGYKGRVVQAGQNLPHPVFVEAGHDHNHQHEHDEHEHTTGQIDPHAWHDVRNVQHFVVVIAEALRVRFPGSAAAIEGNAAAYTSELSKLHSYAAEQLGSIPPERRKLATSHDSLRYLAHAYGLQIVPIAGLQPQREPSAKELAALIKRIRAEKVRAVFFEGTSNPKLSRVVAEEANLPVLESLYTDSLGAEGSSGATYLGMFRSNVDTLVRALR